MARNARIRIIVESALLALAVAYFLGCAGSSGDKSSDDKSTGESTARVGKTGPPPSTQLSANDLLHANELVKFRPERSIDDVLNDVQWRGDLEIATMYKGKSACSIMYWLIPDGATDDDDGEEILAVFTDHKFTKFVRPPARLPDELGVRYDPAYERDMPFVKPIKAGDCRYLIRELESAPIKIADLKKEASKKPDAPSHIDPGLTAVFAVLGPVLSLKWNVEAKKNVALRDQFNAARLRIGMTQREVEVVLKAKPLESGKVDGGTYQIYGSDESFDMHSGHFSNILVLLHEGKASLIRSVAAGYHWRQGVANTFLDLPAPDVLSPRKK